MSLSCCRTFVMPSRMCINLIHDKKGILHQSDNATSVDRYVSLGLCCSDSYSNSFSVEEMIHINFFYCCYTRNQDEDNLLTYPTSSLRIYLIDHWGFGIWIMYCGYVWDVPSLTTSSSPNISFLLFMTINILCMYCCWYMINAFCRKNCYSVLLINRTSK